MGLKRERRPQRLTVSKTTQTTFTATSTATPLSFTNATDDTVGENWSVGANPDRLTVTETGLYLVQWGMPVDIRTANTQITAYIQKNSAGIFIPAAFNGAAGIIVPIGNAGTISMKAGDYFRLAAETTNIANVVPGGFFINSYVTAVKIGRA